MNTLKEFREAIRKNKDEMAKEFEISKSFYEKIENGERKPGRELIERIKKKYPLLDINIFLNLEHTNCGVNADKTQKESE